MRHKFICRFGNCCIYLTNMKDGIKESISKKSRSAHILPLVLTNLVKHLKIIKITYKFILVSSFNSPYIC